MALFTIPDQGNKQYIYERQQPVLSAAFPRWANHFDSGRLYVPCEPEVGIAYRPWWHPMALGIKDFTTGFPPPPIKYFELEGHAYTDKANPRGRVAVREGRVSLDLLRKRVEEVRQKTARQIDRYRKQEKQGSPYTVALTPAEIMFLESGKERCLCGHLEAFHSCDESFRNCQIAGCQGCASTVAEATYEAV